MDDVVGAQRPPLGIRLLHALGKEPDWLAMTADELVAFSEAVNRKRMSPLVQYADSRTLKMAQMRLFHRLSVPPRTDPRALSPLQAETRAPRAGKR